jgi:hypothetical protein
VYVWKLLDGEHTLGAVFEKVSRHAEDVHEKASVHIEAFIDALVAEGLAGFDNSDLGPDTAGRPRRNPPLGGYVSEASPFIYEPPRLVDFREGRVAQGSCGNGSADYYGCYTGNVATGCCGYGSGASGSSANPCCNGNCDSYDCSSGGSRGYCCPGTCYGQVATCGTGSGVDGRLCNNGNCARNPCSSGTCINPDQFC